MIDIRSSEPSIQNHLRKYYSLLDSGKEFKISELFESYRLLKPSLHKLIDSPQTDTSALGYAVDRLPHCTSQTKKIIIAQSLDQLKSINVDISGWEEMSSPARRRQNYFHAGSGTLVVLTSSDSDLDDLINCLIAYQIETAKTSLTYDIVIQGFPLNSSFYQSTAASWWTAASRQTFILDLASTPIYFVSSNFHSLTNLIGGFANQRQDQIITFIEKNHPDLYRQWEEIKLGKNAIRVIDFLYFLSGKFFKELAAEQRAKSEYELSLGIKTIRLKSQMPCDVQLIPVSAIAKSSRLDLNLNVKDKLLLQKSHAFILNIEYPLGFAAYYLFQEILANLNNLKSVYVIGKAAILSGEIGDIQIPGIVFDERTNNILHLNNIFNSYFPFPALQGKVLSNQKAIAVYGTFLENEAQLNNYISTSFNIIEMESGPFLTAIYQHLNRLPGLPQNTVARLSDLPFDLGVINYASDNPLSHTLGDSPMALKGVEPTYLAALTVIQRIIDLESV